jgi:hypothetical protein
MTTRALIALGALTLVPLAAHAETVTYDFTGVVTQVIGNAYSSSVTAGETITGTYTLNFAAADPSQSAGTVGSQNSDWTANKTSGSINGTAPDTNYVFTSTAQVGSTSYSTDPSQAKGYDLVSTISGTTGFSPYYSAAENSFTSGRSGTGSDFVLHGVAWTSAGLPDFAAATNPAGAFFSYDNTAYSSVVYSVNSLTPAPLPGAVWLMLSGVGALGAIVRKRKAA